MANAKKCDRCGKFYECNESRLKGYEGLLCGVSFVRTRHTGNVRYIDDKDLCDECIAKFKRFMAGCELKEE